MVTIKVSTDVHLCNLSQFFPKCTFAKIHPSDLRRLAEIIIKQSFCIYYRIRYPKNLRHKPRDLTFLAQISPSYSNDAHYEYAMGLRSGLMIGILLVWLRNRKKQNAEELFLIIRNELEIWRKGDFAI